MRVAAIIPAHDEAAILERNAKRVSWWGAETYGEGFALVLSENGSTDSTAWVARLVERLLPSTTVVTSSSPGKGGAVKRAAAAVDADVYLMMDADLSADFASAEALVSAVASGADAAIGSRRMAGAVVDRPFVRRLATATYAAAARAVLGLRVEDLQCGCKAFSRRVRDEILPKVRDDGFFFDTEFLARLARGGFRIEEMPVRWTDRSAPGRASKVRLFSNGLDFLKKLASLRKDLE
ncbi:MAG TPA: glycosyltransferase [Candidatus Baltobacteraceae bacterium]|jgi:glycosyltransferase involved in cell wall biosynthesis|nr:glycosyltransferase [Candidatus Baltobacteraceae bacterium]